MHLNVCELAISNIGIFIDLKKLIIYFFKARKPEKSLAGPGRALGLYNINKISGSGLRARAQSRSTSGEGR